MRRTYVLIPIFLAVAALLASGSGGYASNAIAHQEGLACTVCHDKPGSKLLTDRGKYYEAVGTLDGYDRVHYAFGSCTSCHVSKPGSAKLTKTGLEFAAVVHDMRGLKQFLDEHHPTVQRKWVEQKPTPGQPR
jgi:hypothetical protein